jgi:hypothetical protein
MPTKKRQQDAPEAVPHVALIDQIRRTSVVFHEVTAKDAAVALLVAQGVPKEWAESHVEEAEWDVDGLSYKVRLDEPVKFVRGVFEVDQKEE